MVAPTSRVSAIASLLQTHLETACTPYADGTKDGTIDWNYFSDIHSPELNPKGCFLFDPLTQQNNADISRVDASYQITVRFLVSESSSSPLLEQAYNWLQLLTETIFAAIRKDGISGEYDGLTIKKALIGLVLTGSVVTPSINQDGGGTAAIQLIYTWKDIV